MGHQTTSECPEEHEQKNKNHVGSLKKLSMFRKRGFSRKMIIKAVYNGKEGR
jgi:hypothetical protein